jgi:hypothetical protein
MAVAAVEGLVQLSESQHAAALTADHGYRLGIWLCASLAVGDLRRGHDKGRKSPPIDRRHQNVAVLGLVGGLCTPKTANPPKDRQEILKAAIVESPRGIGGQLAVFGGLWPVIVRDLMIRRTPRPNACVPESDPAGFQLQPGLRPFHRAP